MTNKEAKELTSVFTETAEDREDQRQQLSQKRKESLNKIKELTEQIECDNHSCSFCKFTPKRKRDEEKVAKK